MHLTAFSLQWFNRIRFPALSRWVAASVLGALLPFGSLAAATVKVSSLDIAGAVQKAGSDEASAVFQKEELPQIAQLINTQLGESVSFGKQTAFSLDPTKLKLATDSTARVYFVGEGAGYQNTLGFNALSGGSTTGKSIVSKSSLLIFPNASSTVSTYDPASNARRTSSAPLLPGDFVDLGKFDAGTTLDFFLIADGASGGTTSYAASASRNPDQLNHVVAFVLPDSPFLIIAFEDMLGGGDRDYNDVVFAVDIGAINLERLISTPEPGTWAIMLGCLSWVVFTQRRRSLSAAA
jgi:hypothetical protein